MRRTTPERRTSKARRCSGTTARSEGRATRTKRDVIFTVPATLLPLQLRIGVIAWSMPPASGRSSADPGAWRPGRPSMPSCSVRAILARSGRWPGRRTRRSRRRLPRARARADAREGSPRDFDVVMPPDDRPGSAGPGPVKERRGDQTVRYGDRGSWASLPSQWRANDDDVGAGAWWTGHLRRPRRPGRSPGLRRMGWGAEVPRER